MFQVLRDGLTVYVSGSVSVRHDWSPKAEMLSASQAGVTRCLGDHGFAPVEYLQVSGASYSPDWTVPAGANGVFSGDEVRCASQDAAILAETVLMARVK